MGQKHSFHGETIRGHLLWDPTCRERLLQPLATELLHEAALQSQGGIREAWLQVRPEENGDQGCLQKAYSC